MKCSETRELISMYIDGMLDKAQEKEFLKHMDECSACRSELGDITGLVNACGSIDEEEVPESFRHELHLKLVAEKQRQERASWASILKNRYMKVGSAIAAGLLLVFIMRGVVMDFLPFGSGKTGDIGRSLSSNTTVQSTAEFSDASGPQDESAGMTGSYSANAALGQMTGKQDAAVPELSVNATAAAGTGSNTKAAADAASVNTADADKTEQKRKEVEAAAISRESTRGQSIGDKAAQTTPSEVAMIMGIIGDDNSAAATYDRADGKTTDTAARLFNTANINIKVANPRVESEKIKSYLVSLGAEILETTKAGTTISYTDAEQNSKILQNRMNGGAELVARVPFPLYEKFTNALKTSFSPVILTVYPVKTIDMGKKAAELENIIANMDAQLAGMRMDEAANNVDPDTAAQARQQKQNASLELQQINQGLSNVFVVITLVWT